MTSKSKKLFKMIDGLRPWNSSTGQMSTTQRSYELEEMIKSENFSLEFVSNHGFPFEPSCVAYDPIQKLIAIGTRNGFVKIYGKPGVDMILSHASHASVLLIIFIVNEGELITLCQDDVAHRWNIKNKTPELLHSLQFRRERLTCGHLSMGSSWLYVGTEKGNVHFVQIRNFTTSGYVINWNKAIDLNQSSHPGSVVQMCENPQDSNKLLIAYNSGLVVLWDLKSRTGEARFRYQELLYGLAWHYEGRNFITCHGNGLLVTWNSKQPGKPLTVQCPHAGGDVLPEERCSYESIRKVDWVQSRASQEPLIIFSGGSSLLLSSSPGGENASSQPPPPPSITVMRGKRLSVMQMDYSLVDFATLNESPYASDPTDPCAVAVLLSNDLVMIDLLSPTYPTFENPYSMDLHSSRVTVIKYVSECSHDLWYALFSLQKRKQPSSAAAASNEIFSAKEWPVNGGDWANANNTRPDQYELIITGHADGSVRFWDATFPVFSSLYQFRTSRLFEPHRGLLQKLHSSDPEEANRASSSINAHFCPAIFEMEEDPIGIRLMEFCPVSWKLLVASSAHLCLMKFSKQDATSEISFVDVNIEHLDDSMFLSPGDSGVGGPCDTGDAANKARTASQSSYPSSSSHEANKDMKVFVAIRPGVRAWLAGMQPELVCRVGVASLSFELGPASSGPQSAASNSCILPPPQITACAYNSATGLMAFGNDSGLVIIDCAQRVILTSMATSDLYGPADYTNRSFTKSPGKNATTSGGNDSASSIIMHASHSRSNLADTNALDALVEQTNGGRTTPPQNWQKAAKKLSILQRMSSMVQKSVATNGHCVNKTDARELSHSFSSSVSSLEQFGCETIKVLNFAETYLRKNDAFTSMTLWVGTKLGSLIVMSVQMADAKGYRPISVAASGVVFRLHGEIVNTCILDCQSGDIQLPAASKWTDQQEAGCANGPTVQNLSMMAAVQQQSTVDPAAKRLGMITVSYDASQAGKSRADSPTGAGGQQLGEFDRHLVCVSSDKQIRVIAMPSQTCIYKTKMAENVSLVCSQGLQLAKGPACNSYTTSAYLVCFMNNGRFAIYSLPSMRVLMDAEMDQQFMDRSPKLVSFTQTLTGQYACFMHNSTELMKVSWAADFKSSISRLRSDIFVAKPMPEPPKKNFLKNLFSGSIPAQQIDRDELFGEDSAGKSVVGTTMLVSNPSMGKLTDRSGGTVSDIAKARNAALERGERLAKTEERTEEMMNQAKSFARNSQLLANKYEKRDKRWNWSK